MIRKILIICLFVVVFIILPATAYFLAQHFWGNRLYSAIAFAVTWCLFSVIVLIVEFRTAKVIDEDSER
jgi:hypothetical protein